MCDQGLYIIFQTDRKRACHPITKYTFRFCNHHYGLKKKWAVRSCRCCLGNSSRLPVVNLTTGWASVRASTVDHSGGTMCWKPAWDQCASWVHSVCENIQYSNMFHVLAIICTWLRCTSKSEALTGFYSAWIVSSSLALDLSGAQYSFDLDGILSMQDPSKW